MTSVKLRIELEKRIAKAFVKAALDAGHLISVWNGGDEPELEKSAKLTDIMKAMFLTDMEELVLYKDGSGERVGWVLFVYGNDGWDVISDYSANDAVEALMKEPNRISEKYQ